MAGASIKGIKTRINSIENTMQITNAMKLVASSKLRKAKKAAEESKAYFNTMYETIVEISYGTKGVKNVFLKERDVHKICHIVIAGDRGLAGGYNSNVFKETKKCLTAGVSSIVPIGKKAVDHYKKEGYDILDQVDTTEGSNYQKVSEISKHIMEMYKTGCIDEVYLTYTQFISPLTQEVKIIKLLPLVFHDTLEFGHEKFNEEAMEPDENTYISEDILKQREFKRQEEEKRAKIEAQKKDKKFVAKIKYLPSPEKVLEHLIPTYVSGVINGAVVESFASEQGARRTAMESATDNAKDMLSELELKYNRARQTAITQEITEIVGGAAALK